MSGARVSLMARCGRALTSVPALWVPCRQQPARGLATTIRLGEVRVERRVSPRPEHVPVGYGRSKPTADQLGHLKWMMKKDGMKQDMFLVGPPGPERLRLALWYAELVGRDVEVLNISRDTTESDLKQRREITNGNVLYVDAAPVRAALNGSLLILNGIEKAERNVLPTLNNLLENREMALADGRFLTNTERYDRLLATHSEAELANQNLVRVHPDFRVIALGLPVPAYPGFPLDPPLRSRFQARYIGPPPVAQQIQTLQAWAPTLPTDTLRTVLALSDSLRTMESEMQGGGRPLHFPNAAVLHAVRVLSQLPSTPLPNVLSRVYPTALMAPDQQTTIGNALHKLAVDTKVVDEPGYRLVRAQPTAQTGQWEIELAPTDTSSQPIKLKAPGGPNADASGTSRHFVSTEGHQKLLASMAMDHALGRDLCLVGPKGEGKSAFVRHFALTLGYSVETIQLYRDMTSRDLLQRRTTDHRGNTTWELAPLVTAAKEGRLAVLDGLHRLPYDSMAVLHQLIYDRELTLFDGTRLVSQRRLALLQSRGADTTKLVPIHPSFRIIALSNPPQPQSPTADWLMAESLPLFAFHQLPTPCATLHRNLLTPLFPSLPAPTLNSLLQLAGRLDDTVQAEAQAGEPADQPLSIRQLIRICRRANAYPADLYETVQRTTLAPFMPAAIREAFEATVADAGIVKQQVDDTAKELTVDVHPTLTGSVLSIGDVSVPVSVPTNPQLVPHITFFNIPSHVLCLQDLAKDLLTGERHLLLIGNQGTGKNKLADRLLMLLGREREYIQLHRDTTVQSLTLAPTLQDGTVVWEDSALVRAVREGRVLVVDEADKAPVEVVCVLKGLVEDGQMSLADGRRILDPRAHPTAADTNVIKVHPDFQMIVLANRPGYPFLGNDFFKECGDVFSCHVISNPDATSELSLLQSYAPNVPVSTLQKVIGAFNAVRQQVEGGLLSYPYSTRELVNVARHLQAYPTDSLSEALGNVFAFDSRDKETLGTLKDIMHSHGIPLAAGPDALVDTAPRLALAEPQLLETWTLTDRVDVDTAPVSVPSRNESYLFATKKSVPTNKHNQRIRAFTEQVESWQVDVQGGRAGSACRLEDGSVHVLTNKPYVLHSHPPQSTESQHLEVGFVPSNVAMHMHTATGGHVTLTIPDAGLVYRLEPGTCTARSFTMPTDFAGPPIRLQLLYTKPKAAALQASIGSGSNHVVFYRKSTNTALSLDTATGEAMTAVLPPSVQPIRLMPLAHTACLLADASSQIYWLDWKTAGLFKVAIQPRTRLHSTPLAFTHTHTWPDAGADRHLLGGDPMTYAAWANLPVQPQEGAKIDVHGFLRSHPRPGPSSNIMPFKGGAVVWDNSGLVEVLGISPNVATTITVPGTQQLPNQTETSSLVGVGQSDARDLVTVQADGTVRTWQMDEAQLHADMDQWLRLFGAQKSLTEDAGLVIEEDGPGGERTQRHGMNVEMEEDIDGYGSSAPYTSQGDGIEGFGAGGQGHGQGGGGGGGQGGAGGSGAGGGQGDDKKSDGFGGYKRGRSGQIEASGLAQDIEQMAADALDPTVKRSLEAKSVAKGQRPSAYQSLVDKVQRQIQQLRVVLEATQAKENERQWLTNQKQGELDDAKLVDGVTGETLIYRKRGQPDRQAGLRQSKPKRVRFVVDVSASMARFNSWDGRLDRMAEMVVMVMEGMAGFDHKFSYSIVGHSGASPCIPFVDYGRPPMTAGDRMEVVQRIYGYSNGAVSGDTTLHATSEAIKNVTAEPADDYFVFVVSDANMGRYDITPEALQKAMAADSRVNAYAIFIAEKGAASYLTDGLPYGKGFVCLDNALLPTTFKDIFVHASHMDH